MISRLIIENFKSIRAVDIELKPLNILIGANGAGKSNFISFFKLLNKIYKQELQDYVAYNTGAEDILYYGTKESKYLASKIYFDNTNFYDFKLKPDKSNSLYFDYERDGFNKNFELIDTSPDWIIEELKERNNEGKQESLIQTNSKRRIYFKNHFNSFKVFHFHDTSTTANVKKRCKIDDNYYLREDAGNLASVLFFLQSKNPSNFRLIEKTVKSVAPFFKAFDLKPFQNNEDSIKLEWKEAGSDKYFDASNLSDGTLRFICLATLLLLPKLPETIIIDEPELGLHPFAIGKLSGLIKKASLSTQIIVSTQSANLIEYFDAEDIIIVNRDKKQSTFKRLEKQGLEVWLDEYTISEIWDKNIIGGRP